MTTCVWKLHRSATKLLGELRTQAGLEVCHEEETVWIRCHDVSDELQRAFLKLPVVNYWQVDHGQLIRRGTRVPHGYVPEGPWFSIADWMEVTLPLAGLGGVTTSTVPLEMVPSDSFAMPQLLQTDIQAWTKYAVSAPRIRLDQLAFIATGEGTVFVKGEPLPPIRGKRFILSGSIAVEAGWTWQPPVDAAVLQASLDIRAGDLAVMDSSGNWLRLPEDCFVQAARSAVRATSEGFGDVY